MNDNLCSICKTSVPQFICFCSEVQLCSQCISYHLLSEPSRTHKPIPVTSSDLIKSLQMHAGPEPKDVEMTEANRPNEAKRVMIDREMKRLMTFQSDIMVQLERLKLHYETEISRTIEELWKSIQGEIGKLAEELQKGLSDLTDQQPLPVSVSPLFHRMDTMSLDENLLTLSLELKPLDLSTTIRQSLSFVCQYNERKIDFTRLYKFFGGSSAIGLFDAESERYEKLPPSSMKFPHNSCWCSTPSGDLIITGGSMAGRSRTGVTRFSPLTGAVQDLEPMNVARRSHTSLYQDKFCYVFGGLLDEERISLCERYDSDLKQWSALPNMNERRAYHGCCIHKNLIFVCGGAETSSCEMLNLAEGRFQLLSVPNVEFGDDVSVLNVGESILVFHGNFNGEVSRVFPLTGQVSTEQKLCYGNSWSSCAPLLVNNKVYMLRADSIFKYELNSGSSSYVLRMTKSSNRREYE